MSLAKVKAVAEKARHAFGVHRVHHTHAVTLLVLEAGKVKDVALFNATGQVLVADLDELKGLSPEEAETKVLLGAKTQILGHAAFEVYLENLVNPPKPDETAASVVAEPASETKGSIEPIAAPLVPPADPVVTLASVEPPPNDPVVLVTPTVPNPPADASPPSVAPVIAGSV